MHVFKVDCLNPGFIWGEIEVSKVISRLRIKLLVH